MTAVLIKRGQSLGKTFGSQKIGTLRCEGCGGEFLIRHHPTVADHAIATKQALWLEKILADEHERDRKHSDQIELPECSAWSRSRSI